MRDKKARKPKVICCCFYFLLAFKCINYLVLKSFL